MKTFQTLFSKIFMLSFIALLSMGFTSCEEKADVSGQISQDDIDSMIANHIISLKDAEKMYKKYSSDRVKILKDTLKKKYKDSKFEDTRMVWFDITDMKAYIKYVEDKSAEVGVTPKGLQVYFSVYPNNQSKYGDSKDHQTFFIAPTETTDQQSGYTLDSNDKIIYLRDVLKDKISEERQSAQKAGYFAIRRNGDGLLYNDGSSSPPH
ncbi:MAG: hypothetical protein QNJ57_02035 [Flavobacteriaceae bacterium]|nr:hypothetical protein [Flavobacteriaceae bacterium]